MGRRFGAMSINDLPDEILGHVISCLSPEDAAKARLLSRRWRHLFASPVNLHLNPFTVIGIKIHDIPLSKGRRILSDYKSKFMDGVDQVLEQCIMGSISLQKVGTIRFSFQLTSESASRIDHWISLALQMKPRSLHLDFSLGDYDMKVYHAKRYCLPLRLLRVANPQLEHLILKSCFLGLSPDSLDHLHFLKKLDLDGVALSQHDLDNVFSCCSNLLWLKIRFCCLPPGTLRIGGEGLQPHLETVIVQGYNSSTIIELNSLRKLCTFEIMNSARDVNFINVPLLEKVHMHVYGHGFSRNQMIHKLADNLSQLQFLSLFGNYSEEPPMINFKHLKDLEIFFPDSHRRTWITQLVNAFPVLQKLHVTILRNQDRRGQDIHQTQCHFHLKEVRISGFRGATKDMQLAISLLKNAIMLNRMHIDPSARIYHGANEWSLEGLRWEFDKKHVCELLLRERPNSWVEITVL